MSELRPILSSLSRHKGAALILILEIALTCGILCNALDLVHRRMIGINLPSGIDEAHLVTISGGPLIDEANAMSQTVTELSLLQQVPGVASVAVINQVPLMNSSSNSGVSADAEGKSGYVNAATFLGGDRTLETLGLKLVAGRDFLPEEYETFDTKAGFGALKLPAVIITRALAEKLYPDGKAVGKLMYGPPSGMRIVGVVDTLLRPSRWMKEDARNYATINPLRTPISVFGRYVIRVKDGQDPLVVLNAAKKTLDRAYPRRITDEAVGFKELREKFYAADRSMVWLLVIVCTVLLAVTAFGIVGLASFWVQQRTQQIGIRRALGATRANILRYFQLENFLIVTAGVALGMVMAFGINHVLMAKYELARLPWYYLPIGALVLWCLGQLAVLWPALRAASIPPATATRSL